MSTLRTLLPALGAGFAVSLGAGQEIVFRPESGARVTKTFLVTGEYELDELSLIVGGQDVGAMIPAVEMSMRQETKVEVTDVYRSYSDGRLRELARTYDVLSGWFEMMVTPSEEEIPEMESASELEGRTVIFRWNEDKGEYDRSFESGETDPDLVAKLDEDMDLRVFLPEDAVEPGDTWTVPLADLGVLLMPGGDLRFRPTDLPMDEGAMEKLEELFAGFADRYADLVEGECTCTYKGTRDVDGKQMAEIAIDLGVATTLDLAEMLEEIIRTAIEESDAGVEVEFTIDGADLNIDFDGEGVLLWSLAANRAHGFHLSGDAIIGMDLVVGVSAQGESQDVDASLEFSGTLTHELVTSE